MKVSKNWIRGIVKSEIENIISEKVDHRDKSKYDYVPKDKINSMEDYYRVKRRRAINSATAIANKLDPIYEAMADIPSKGSNNPWKEGDAIIRTGTRFSVFVRHPQYPLEDRPNVSDPDEGINTVSKPGYCSLNIDYEYNPNRDDAWPDEESDYVQHEGEKKTDGIVECPDGAVRWLDKNLRPTIEEVKERDTIWDRDTLPAKRMSRRQKSSVAKDWPENVVSDRTKDSDEYSDRDYV